MTINCMDIPITLNKTSTFMDLSWKLRYPVKAELCIIMKIQKVVKNIIIFLCHKGGSSLSNHTGGKVYG